MLFLDHGLVSTLLSILSLSCVFCLCGGKKQVDFDLHNHLLNPKRYNPAIIPTCGKDDNVTVKIGVALRDIVEVVEKQQIIRVKVWVRLRWKTACCNGTRYCFKTRPSWLFHTPKYGYLI